MQDAARERYRRRVKLRERRKRWKESWLRRGVARTIDAGQQYIVITLIGTTFHGIRLTKDSLLALMRRGSMSLQSGCRTLNSGSVPRDGT